MILGEITDKIRFHYAWMRKLQSDIPTYEPRLPEVVADALRDAHAAKLKAQFNSFGECDCTPARDDPRHNYDDSAWQEAAERLLKGG